MITNEINDINETKTKHFFKLGYAKKIYLVCV